MTTPAPDSSTGRLEIVCIVTALSLGMEITLGLLTFDIAIVLILLVAAYGVLPDVRASFYRSLGMSPLGRHHIGTAPRLPSCMFVSTQKVSKYSHVE